MRLAGVAGGIGWSWAGLISQIRLQNLSEFLNRNSPPAESVDDVAGSLVVTSGAKHRSDKSVCAVKLRFRQSEKLCLRTVFFYQGINGNNQFCIHGWALYGLDLLVVLTVRKWRTL